MLTMLTRQKKVKEVVLQKEVHAKKLKREKKTAHTHRKLQQTHSAKPQTERLTDRQGDSLLRRWCFSPTFRKEHLIL